MVFKREARKFIKLGGRIILNKGAWTISWSPFIVPQIIDRSWDKKIERPKFVYTIALRADESAFPTDWTDFLVP